MLLATTSSVTVASSYFGGAVAHDAVTRAATTTAGVHRVVDLVVTSLRPRTITATPVALALELHLAADLSDPGHPAGNHLSVIQRVRRPDVTAEQRHSVVDADVDVVQIIDRIGCERRLDALGGGGIGPFLLGRFWRGRRTARDHYRARGENYNCAGCSRGCHTVRLAALEGLLYSDSRERSGFGCSLKGFVTLGRQREVLPLPGAYPGTAVQVLARNWPVVVAVALQFEVVDHLGDARHVLGNETRLFEVRGLPHEAGQRHHAAVGMRGDVPGVQPFIRIQRSLNALAHRLVVRPLAVGLGRARCTRGQGARHNRCNARESEALLH